MNENVASNTPGDDGLTSIITAFLSGDPSAGDQISLALREPTYLAVRAFLGDESADVDDIVQDSILAVLHYLEKNREFSGNLIKFAVTVARNRARNLLNWRQRHRQVQIDPMLDWLANPERSPLDALLDQEVDKLLQNALDKLAPDCQVILRAFYLENRTIEQTRRLIGLKTVQGIYYRRTVCLEQAYRHLKKRLAICSSQRDRKPGRR